MVDGAVLEYIILKRKEIYVKITINMRLNKSRLADKTNSWKEYIQKLIRERNVFKLIFMFGYF